MTRQIRWRNTGGVLVALMLGWGPLAHAAPRPSLLGTRSTDDITYALRTDADGSFVLAASSSEVSLRKAVYEDGHSVTTIERGADRVTIATSAAGVVVSRNGRSATIGVDARDETPWVGVRALLAGSPAVRAFRAWSASLEASESRAPEHLGLRFSGAMVALLDGDEGAPARLSRELSARYGGPMRRAGASATDCWNSYQAAVMKAASELESCLKAFAIWDPRRQVCAFIWTLQVEGAWFAYLACCSVPIN